MPKLFPFRAVHFEPRTLQDLTPVVTQPYDRIDSALQDVYYQRHPHNIVRIIKRKEESGDATGLRKYSAAATTLREWLETGVLTQDSTPALYVYHQIYTSPEGVRARKGIVSMVKLEEPGKGKILPHEETHTGPKIDRLHLLTHTRAHFGQVFLLYSDPEKKVDAVLDPFTEGPPLLEAKDDLGEVHRVWPVTDETVIRQIQKILDPKEAIIADGHHRYETAWAFRNEMMKQKAKGDGAESYENVMATLINMDDEGLMIFPTHRVLYGVVGFDLCGLLKRLNVLFDIREYPYAEGAEETLARRDLLEDLRFESVATAAFGLISHEVSTYYLLMLKDRKAAAARVKEKKSTEWRSLDVNLLHSVILDGMLGVTAKTLAAEKNVEYVRHAEEAIARVKSGPPYQMAFLVNPVRIEQIRAIVRHRERFPQKTTDFYPKLLTGLVMCKLNGVS